MKCPLCGAEIKEERKLKIDDKEIAFNIYRCSRCHKDFIRGGEEK